MKKSLPARPCRLDDIVTVLTHVLKLENDPEAQEDNIDHLGCRRVRYVGEMLEHAPARRPDPHEAQYPGPHVDD